MAGEIETLNNCPCCLRNWVKRHIKVPPADMKFDGDCPICHEPYSTRDFSAHIAVSITDVPSCPGHVLGLECIAGWIADKATNNTCPMCRGKLFHIRGLYDEGEGEGRDSQDGEGVDDDTEHQDEEGTDEVEEQQDDGMPPLEKVPQNADVADEDEEEHDDDLPPLEEVSQNADVADSENNGDIGGKRPGLVPPVSHTTATSAQVMAKEQGMESHETKDDTAGDGRADLHNSLDITTANEGPKSAHEQVLDEEKNREKQETEGHTDSNSDTSSDQVEPPPFDHITDLWDPYLFSDAEPDSDSDDESIGVLYPPFLGTLRTCLIEAVHMHRYQDVSQRINELEDKSEEFKKSIEEYKNSTALQSIYAFFGGVIVGGLLILKWPGLVGVMKGQYFGSD